MYSVAPSRRPSSRNPASSAGGSCMSSVLPASSSCSVREIDRSAGPRAQHPADARANSRAAAVEARLAAAAAARRHSRRTGPARRPSGEGWPAQNAWYSRATSRNKTAIDQSSEMMWCITTTRTCSLGENRNSRARNSGDSSSRKGLRASRCARAMASASRWAGSTCSRSTTVSRCGLAGSTTCIGSSPAVTIFVRSDSCRATTSVSVRCKASRSSGPRNRIAMGML